MNYNVQLLSYISKFFTTINVAGLWQHILTTSNKFLFMHVGRHAENQNLTDCIKSPD